jgi:hypothetical protein
MRPTASAKGDVDLDAIRQPRVPPNHALERNGAPPF